LNVDTESSVTAYPPCCAPSLPGIHAWNGATLTRLVPTVGSAAEMPGSTPPRRCARSTGPEVTIPPALSRQSSAEVTTGDPAGPCWMVGLRDCTMSYLHAGR
jgi:hypothetical protein